MINKKTIISDLPLRFRLIAHCYSCEQTAPVDHDKFKAHSLESISDEMQCPACNSGNMGIRPILVHSGFNWRATFSLIKSKLKRKILLQSRAG